MNTESIHQRLAHKARVILVTCLLISSTIYSSPAPVSAKAALQTAAPDLAITQAADQETVSTGDPVGFTIAITNNGNGIANNVTLTDTVPTAAELSWSVSGTDAAACTITAGVVSCNFGDMAPGAVKTIRVSSPTQFVWGKGFCPTISSTATVMATNQPESKSATAIVRVLCPSVYMQLLADNQDSQNIPAGNPVSFTVKFGNMGEGVARDVIAEIALPTNPGLSWSILSSTPAEAANNCVYGTDYTGTYELICSFDQMDPQQEVTITLTSPTTSASCGTVNSIGYLSLSNGAWVRYIMKPPIITCTPDLAITQIADQETVSSADPVGFTITITNNGGGIANSVTLTDTLPIDTGLAWSVSGTDAATCTNNAGVLSCNFGDMPPGAVKTIRLTSPTPNASDKASCPTISNTATVMASNLPEGRSATASITVLCPRVYIDVWPDTPRVTAGDPVSFTVTVGNMGEGIAKDVDSEVGLPNNPGLSWSITNVTPASAAGNCTIDTSGTSPELLCSFAQIDPLQDVLITVTSPTTSGSCGTLSSGGTVTSSNGGANRARVAAITVSCTVAATVQPGEVATLTLPSGRGQIEFPADLVTLPTTFTYTAQNAPSQALGSYTFAGLSFTLVATDANGNPVTLFPANYTIQLTYQDSDWQDAGIADESLLNLAYWDTAAGQWVNVLPCGGCSLDPEQNQLVVVLNHLTEFALIGSIATDAEPPTTSASISPEANASGWYAGPVTVTLMASDSDSGIHNTEYNLSGSGWTTYSAPFVVSIESTSSTLHNIVQYRSTDEAGNVEETKSLTIQIDATAPTVGASVPLRGNAVQGGIKFGVNLADPLSGPAGAMLSIREADGASGKEIGYENLVAAYNSTSGNWELDEPFDTTQLPDGFYVLAATGKDVAGNEKTEIIPFSVRNWALLELLPSTENNKAGRTMPIKFSLRVVKEVDPAQPFVYSEELTITIYEAGKLTPVLQSSTFGSGATDYRINAAQQVYITNFQTLKKPMQYTVEILRDALSIGRFGFQTTK